MSAPKDIQPDGGDAAFDASRYSWIEQNLSARFATFAEEVQHFENLGYRLVPPDYKIPHWSEETRNGEPLPLLFVSATNGIRPFTAALDRYAGELGYPLFFKANQPTPETEL